MSSARMMSSTPSGEGDYSSEESPSPEGVEDHSSAPTSTTEDVQQLLEAMALERQFSRRLSSPASSLGYTAAAADESNKNSPEGGVRPRLTTGQLFTAGMIAGMVGKTVTAPIDRVRILYQVGGFC